MKKYPNGYGDIDVDKRIKKGRLLTGSDFDLESFRQMPDGTFYFGDEFGPFILHTDATGKLLEAPIEITGLKSPQHPQLNGEKPTVDGSGGFEGMALNLRGDMLYPMLEKPLEGQDWLNIYEYDMATMSFTHWDPRHPAYKYKVDENAEAIGDFTAISEREFLVIERDGMQGPDAKFKRIFHIDLDKKDEAGFLKKSLVLDLLNIPDPDNVSGFGGGIYSFPYLTIEGVVILDERTIGVVNDNNYPFSVGRYPIKKQPDPNEMIVFQLDQPLTAY